MLSCVPIMQMRSVSVELEILGRHQHPELTIPFLKVIFLLFSYSIYLGIFGCYSIFIRSCTKECYSLFFLYFKDCIL